MKRKTVIYVVKDENAKEFIVRNRNTEDFQKSFREMFNKLNEDKYLDHEVDNIMADLWDDETFEIIKIFDATNNYNRDQKTINTRKQRITDKYICDGWTENPNLDNIVSSGCLKYDINNYNKTINVRNLGTLLDEKTEELQKAIENTQKAIEKQEIEYNKKINELEKNYQKAIENQEIEYNKNINELEKQFQEKQDEIRLKSAKFIEDKRNELRIKLNEEQHNYELSLDKIKDNYYSEIEKLKDEKKTLENECAEIVKLKNKRDSLKSEISFLDSSKINLEADIQKLYNEYDKKQSSVSSLNTQIEKLKNTYNQVINDLLEKNKLLSAVKNKIETIDERTRFYAKDFADLQMWEKFAADYGYDKTGIIKLRADIEELNKMKTL